jgi:hypothetical protein
MKQTAIALFTQQHKPEGFGVVPDAEDFIVLESTRLTLAAAAEDYKAAKKFCAHFNRSFKYHSLAECSINGLTTRIVVTLALTH